jgi:SPP1 family predicted phage head-tail adaptor
VSAGELRYRVDLEQQAESRGSAGGASRTWSLLATVWADVQPSRGQEFFASRQLLGERNAVIKIRYRSDVSNKTRVKHEGQYYNVVDAVPDKGRKAYLLLYASTGVSPEGI